MKSIDCFRSLLFLVLLGGSVQAQHVLDLSLAGAGVDSDAVVHGTWAAFTVLEVNEAQDLTGDNDTDDRCMFVCLGANGPTRNLHLPVPQILQHPAFLCSDRLCAFLVNEINVRPPTGIGGTDLNGDGDWSDTVVHVYDRVTDTVWNTHVAMDPNDAAAGGWVVTEDRVIFMVREAGQSQDLDGSGFQDHTVLEAWDLSGTITNIGAPVRSGDGIVVAGGHLFFAQDEADSGHDLNGDGDQLDRVAQSLDLTSMTTANLGLRVVDFRAEGNLVAMRVQESGQGQDLDGDGDLNDWVLFVHYPLTGTTVNLGIDVGDHFPQRSLIEMSGYLIAARGNEGGTHDWNGDGDTSDNILFVYNARTGVLTNTHEAMLSDSSTGGYPFVISGDTVLFSVSEAFQGQADLNGDGDITDRIVHSFRATPPSITNLGLALPEGVQHPFRASNTHCAFLVGENEQGHQDLNGDGILGDNVLHLLDLSTGIVSNLQERVFNPEDYVLSGRDLAWTVRERSGQDLNGDGDSMDSVLFSREGSTGLVTNHHLAVFEVPGLVGMRLGRGFVLFSASEAGQGQMSLNGDTDSNDLVFHTLSF